MKSILDNWVAVEKVWDESLDGNLEPEINFRIIDIKSQMNTFNYFYRVTTLQLIQNTLKVLSYFLSRK